MSMCARSPGLSARIAAEILESGPMRFSRFMELALYDPHEGYYASGRAAVGRGGDFFTSVSLGPVFGEVLAGQFVEMWETLGRPADFMLVEQGANDGRLAADVLDALSETPLANARFAIVEPFEPLREVQRTRLAGHRVEWSDSPAHLPPFTGVHFSNELFDALPVDLLEARDGVWKLLRVVWDENAFKLETSETVDPGWPARPDGFRAELRAGQRELLEALSSKMQRGFLLAIDYGMTRNELLSPHRAGGTLSCYSAHRRDSDPFERIGEKDLTAHVDFTALAGEARRCGLEPIGYTDQHHFLVGAGTALLQSLDGRPPTPDSMKKLRALRTLLHPETMGVQFKVLLASKGIPAAHISGFRHARDLPF
jgi:SAM-dependent MidA family methyltransferase